MPSGQTGRVASAGCVFSHPSDNATITEPG